MSPTHPRTLRRPLVLLLGALLAAGCRSQAPTSPEPAELDRAALEAELRATDEAFAAAAFERGIEGWLSFFEEDAAKIPVEGAIVRGHAAIRAADTGLFADPDVKLLWEPDLADVVATPGQPLLGVTRGRYTLMRFEADGGETALATGTYVSVWRRGPDGWRCPLDLGVPDKD
jgi:ketosteroid isomerase-like protein